MGERKFQEVNKLPQVIQIIYNNQELAWDFSCQMEVHKPVKAFLRDLRKKHQRCSLCCYHQYQHDDAGEHKVSTLTYITLWCKIQKKSIIRQV